MNEQVIFQPALQPFDEIIKVNQWIYETIRPYIKGRTFELGSGTGLFSSLLIENGIRTHLNEIDKSNQTILIDKFKQYTELRGLYELNFLQPDFEKANANLTAAYNSVVAVNIAEHGFYSNDELNNAKLLLSRRGRLITILPAFVIPYEGVEIDQATWKRFNNKFVKKHLFDFDILHGQYFKYSNHPSLLLLIVAYKK